MSDNDADRPGLYLCCMRAAERVHESSRGVDLKGYLFQCGRCSQHVINIGGGWRVANAEEVKKFNDNQTNYY